MNFRYAITTVTCLVHNPATVRQPFKFGFAMPKTALVSDVTILDGGREGEAVVAASFGQSDWLQPREESPSAGQDGDGQHEPVEVLRIGGFLRFRLHHSALVDLDRSLSFLDVDLDIFLDRNLDLYTSKKILYKRI